MIAAAVVHLLLTPAPPHNPGFVIAQDVGFLDNDDTFGFGPENYIIDSGLDPVASQVLGEYQTWVDLFRGDQATETWRLTARVSGQVAWTEEGDFTSSTVSDTFTVSLTEYDGSCGGIA